MSLFTGLNLSPEVLQRLPQGYTIRPLELADYDKGVLDCLRGLTTVGPVTAEQFKDVFEYWKSKEDMFHCIVIVNESGEVVAVGTVLMERKIIHNCGTIGHIEDIAVAKSQQGKQLGKTLILALTDIAKARNCYKVILDCSDHNIAFYEKCGYKKEGNEMAARL